MNAAYPVLPISVLTIGAYFITWLFATWGIFDRKAHRKFWNILLLITFLISGGLGLVSVFKINYRLDIPRYDELLKWHVNVGIVMVIIALFHLSWHLKYYFSRSCKKAEGNDNLITQPIQSEWIKIHYLLIFLGAVTIINQVVFIREFLSVFDGNELMYGVVMATWFLLTGWGAYASRKQIPPTFGLAKGINRLAVLALMPAAMVVLLYWLKSILFPPGTIVGMSMSLVGIFLLLFPVCFLAGYLFTTFSTLYSLSKNENRIGKAYAYESVGSLIGGLIFSMLLGRFFNAFLILGITTGTVLIVGSLISANFSLSKNSIVLTVGVLIPVFVFVFNPDSYVKKLSYPNQEIVLNQSTRYGNLVVTRQAEQLNFYENNTLQFYSDNLALSEEAVHFAMVQHENPQQVLLISGGISGMIKEIKKYPVNEITYLESNPEIFRLWKKLTIANDDLKRVTFVNSDIRTFLKQTRAIYDVILINLPPPSTLGFNRFYTEEFFDIIKNHCNSRSVICTSLPSTMNYAEENALDVNASLWKTMGTQFSNRLLLQGEKNYFLASEKQLSSKLTRLINDKGIVNTYVNSNYIDDDLLAQRGQTLVSQFNQTAKVNHDFYPYMFIKQINHWLSFVGVNYYVLIIVPALLFLLLFFKFKPVTKGLLTGGFTASSLEVTLMFAYQVFFGSLYLTSALFFAVFMGGLALGSQWTQEGRMQAHLKNYSFIQFLLALFSLLLPAFIMLIGMISGWTLVVQFLFFIPVFALAFVIGYEFNMASKLQLVGYSQTAGINYSVDLVGSAIGAFLSAIVLLPLMGLVYTCMVVAALNLLSGFFAFFAPRE